MGAKYIADENSKPAEMYELQRWLFAEWPEVVIDFDVSSTCEIWACRIVAAVAEGIRGVFSLRSAPLMRERLWQNIRIILRQMEHDGWRVYARKREHGLHLFLARNIPQKRSRGWRRLPGSDVWPHDDMEALNAWLLSLPVPEKKLTYPIERRNKNSSQCSS